MRIIPRAEFLRMPAGTLYHKGKPCYFGGLEVKGETMGNDWYSFEPTVALDVPGEWIDGFMAMLEDGKSIPLSDSISRDGLFDDDAIFLVYEPDDLKLLKRQLFPDEASGGK